MANNRLYLVDTEVNEYLCLAKGWGGDGWSVANLGLYSEFMNSRGEGGMFSGTKLILVPEHGDDELYNKWIPNGTNFNKENKWG